MDRIQIALVVIGVLALVESVWGLASPASIKRVVAWFVNVAGPTQGFLGGLLMGVALLLLVLVLVGQPLSSWILLVIALLLAGMGSLCFRKGAFQRMLNFWILNRAVLFVRGVYLVELIVAIAILGVALAGK